VYPDQIIFEPLVTEKAIGARASSVYVFFVHPQATKIDITRAIKALFKVDVTAVNTTKIKPKQRMRGMFAGRTKQRKKAYVTLKPGQKIEELEV